MNVEKMWLQKKMRLKLPYFMHIKMPFLLLSKYLGLFLKFRQCPPNILGKYVQKNKLIFETTT